MSSVAKPSTKRYTSFREFYPFYLSEHSNRTCRRLHFLGSTLAVACIALFIGSGNRWWLAATLLAGYGFAWIGHFAFEKNRPATFQHPVYSFIGDWVMYKDIWTRRIPL